MATMCLKMTEERMQHIALCYLRAADSDLYLSLSKETRGESALQTVISLVFRKGMLVGRSLEQRAARFAPDAMISEDEAKEFFRRLIIEVTNRTLRNSLTPPEVG